MKFRFRLVFPERNVSETFFLLDRISYNLKAIEPSTTPTEDDKSTTTISPSTTPTDDGTITTVIDTADQLTGSVSEAFYVDTADQIPPGLFPDEIIGTTGQGYWLFSSSRPGGIISLKFDTTTVLNIGLTYYNTEPIHLYFQDLAMDEVEVMLPLPNSSNNEWSSNVIEIERDFQSDKPVI